MIEYPKMNTIYKRDEAGTIIDGEYSRDEYQFLEDREWLFEEKVHGLNVRVIWASPNVSFAGRTNNSQVQGSVMQMLISLFRTADKLPKFSEVFGTSTACLYGEAFGGNINGGRRYGNLAQFLLFDATIDDVWVDRNKLEEIARQFGTHVPKVLGRGTLLEAVEQTRTGIKSSYGDFTAEGFVLRPVIPLLNGRGERIIGKIKYKDFAHERTETDGTSDPIRTVPMGEPASGE